MPKIARVIYNRLENPGTAGTIGKLQIDATVNYAAGNTLGAVPTEADIALDSPYNTYANVGLPPGPIESPGDAAIAAAAKPADGDWYYYVTVNLKTGETKFAKTSEEFLQYKQELRDYCANESGGACSKCAVLGDPIAHSLSPTLHRAGYAGDRARTGPTTPSGFPRWGSRTSSPDSGTGGGDSR